MERAVSDVRLQRILGDDISSGAWYQGSVGRGHSGQTASCSFPISGSRGAATLQLKAIRFEGEFFSKFRHFFFPRHYRFSDYFRFLYRVPFSYFGLEGRGDAAVKSDPL
jgi:hypothetical protein